MKEKKYDVLVAGGGVAGAAAALEAARGGLRTALVEKTVFWGGLATSGLVPIYMPLCDGKGRQVTFGLAEELLKASIKYGPGRVPAPWAKKEGGGEEHLESDELYPDSNMGRRYQTWFYPTSLIFALDELLEQAGADLWLDTLVCTPVMKGRAVTGAEVENKSGRVRLLAACVIDATGDADIAFRAGAPCRERGSLPGMLYYTTSLSRVAAAHKRENAGTLIKWEGVGANEMDKGYTGPSGKYSGTDGKQVSTYLLESRKLAREQLAGLQAEAGENGREKTFALALPSMHQIRMSRAIEGVESIETGNMNKLHPHSVGLMADCRQTGAVWEAPYGSLVPQNVENLLVVGRCADAQGYAWQVSRLIGPAALTGQVAGIAAGLAVRQRTSPARLEVKDVQKSAQEKGIRLHQE